MTAHGGPAVALVGATASGKSALAHRLALELGDVDIVSVDAMCVYRGMDLATEKPTAHEQTEVPYHVLDLVEPSEEFTVAQFQRDAREATDEIFRHGRRALFVGGTGLYGRAVLDDLEIPGRYPEVRAALDERAALDLDEALPGTPGSPRSTRRRSTRTLQRTSRGARPGGHSRVGSTVLLLWRRTHDLRSRSGHSGWARRRTRGAG